MGSLFQALAPLAALYLLHKILKVTGLGSLTTMSGSLGLATSAVVAASGDRGWRANTGAAFDGAAGRLGGHSAYGNTTRADRRRADRQALRKEIRRRAFSAAGDAYLGQRAIGASAPSALRGALGAYGADSSRQRQLTGAERLHQLRQIARAGQLGRSAHRLALGPATPARPGTAIPHLTKPGLHFGADPEALAGELDARRKEYQEKVAGLPPGDQRREQLQLELAQLDNDRAVANTFGPEFVGQMLSPPALLAAQAEYAAARGISPDQVIVSSFGLVQEAPVVGGFLTAATVDGTLASLQSFRTWLPDDFKARRINEWGLESDDEYAARLYHTGVAIGAIDPYTGTEVDWLAKNGIDITSDAGRREALNYIEGLPSALATVATVEMSAAAWARVNAVRRDLVPAQARVAPAALQATYAEQETLLNEDVANLTASLESVATTSAPLEAALSEFVTYATTSYENPGFAPQMKSLAQTNVVEITNALENYKTQLAAALAAQATMQGEIEVLDAVAAGDGARLTDAALDEFQANVTAQLENAARASMEALESTIGQLQKAFNRKNAAGEPVLVDPREVQRTTEQALNLLRQQSAQSNAAATTLTSNVRDHLAQAEQLMNQRLHSYSRMAQAGQRPKTASEVVNGL